MQKIFYNGYIETNNENLDISSSMLINDGSVVYTGESEDVLNLKTEDTKLVDLNNKFIYPTFFEFSENLFEQISDRLINSKKIKTVQNPDEINEDYENFSNFEDYKKEYLKIEKDFIKRGVSTLILTRIGKLEFSFLKRISEEKLLTIDIVAYVDMVSSKQVMDDNCVTYRKYRNHLRLGGYYLKIDGRLQELKAWLKRPYKGSKSFCGFSEISEEQLFYLIKEALGEKKQILFDVSGDKAVEEVLNVLDDVTEKENISEFYKPIFYSSGLIDKRAFLKLKKYDVTLAFEVLDQTCEKKVKNSLGISRKKYFENFKELIKNDIRFVIYSNSIFGIDKIKNSAFYTKCKFNAKMHKNNKNIFNFTKLLYKIIYLNFAYICFDQDKKAVLETDKQANFIIAESSLTDAIESDLKFIKNVYIEGEKKH